MHKTIIDITGNFFTVGMPPMIFKFLGGPIISKVVDTGVRYLERKQQITKARHTARLEIEAEKSTADID